MDCLTPYRALPFGCEKSDGFQCPQNAILNITGQPLDVVLRKQIIRRVRFCVSEYLKMAYKCRVSTILLIAITIIWPSHVRAITLEQAIKITLDANPEIGEAIANLEATEFELDQAQGLFLPRLDLTGRTGSQNRDSPTTRAIGTSDSTLFRNEANLVASQLLFDGWESRSELNRQASRVDGASGRVLERSEFISLNVVQQYMEIGRAMRVVQYARENLRYVEGVLEEIKEGVARKAFSVADEQQAQERVFSAEARLIEANEDLNSARIRFLRLVGRPIERYVEPRRLARNLPPMLSEAIGVARQSNPAILIANADIDAAVANYDKSKSEFLPKLNLELQGRAGNNLDGIEGRETDLRAELALRWNLFNGGIDSANKQEQLRRIDEQRYRKLNAYRDVEEAVRLAWERRLQQNRRQVRLEEQLASTNKLIQTYSEQFKVGQRSLLDLLDTQNSRFANQIELETARTASKFADYRILTAMGVLLQTLKISAPSQSERNARQIVGVPPTPDAETEKRWETRVIWTR